MTLYDPSFYDLIRPEAQRSAAVVVPLLLDLLDGYRIEKVVDVGCGEGWWAQRFRDEGIPLAVGIDGDYVQSPAPDVEFVDSDLSSRICEFPAGFDLAVSLEVVEHLPVERGPGFVDDLCRLAPVVAFSGAIPGQPGVGHLNCRWQSEWADEFRRNGYVVSGRARWPMWDDETVGPYYRGNLLVAARRDLVDGGPLDGSALFDVPFLDGPLDVVHPSLHREPVLR